MDRKTVLLLSHYPPPAGGIASWTKRLLAIGLPDGWKIDHVNINTTEGRDPFKNTKRSIGVETRRCLNIWKQEKNFLKNDKSISVVHTCIPCTVFGMMRETVSAIIAKSYKKKFILHCRCTVPNVVNKGWKRIFWKVLTNFCDGIMVLNSKSYDFAKKYSPKAIVEIIPNFVSQDELVDVENRSFESVKHIVYVGGVTIEKGCKSIIEVAPHFPEITFDLVGIVSPEIECMNIPGNVILHGNHDKKYIIDTLEKSDVFLFLSHYWGEGFSNALTEAMAAGLPCIVTDWAANADQIEDKGGIVIANNSVDLLKNAIEKMVDDKNFRESASKWNIQKVNSEYIDIVITRRYTEFYELIVGDD